MPSSFDKLQAIILLTKHLGTLLPFLIAFRRVPSTDIRRIGLLEVVSAAIAENAEMTHDWYTAMQLLAGRDEDLASKSIAELLLYAANLFELHNLHEVWTAAFSLDLLDEEHAQHWVVLEGLTDVNASPVRSGR